MEYRLLGNSGFAVPALTFGTATFGGGNDFFKAWGTTGTDGARDLIARCVDGGVTMFDTADSYSGGLAEEILGSAIAGRRDDVLISTKSSEPVGVGPNDRGSSRWHLLRSVESSLRRMNTDYIDLFYIHLQDLSTPVEETLRALDDLVRSGKVRYIGASNFSAWRLMKSMAVADSFGWNSYIGHQLGYSLTQRDAEWELLPLGTDQGIGTIAYSPLAGGALTGKLRANQSAPADSRIAKQPTAVTAPLDRVHRIVDALSDISVRTGRSISQIALNWLLGRATVSSVVFGARTPDQLEDNLGSVGWSLSKRDLDHLDEVSATPLPYPYLQQLHFSQMRTLDEKSSSVTR
ncbi:MAG: aldo/keto reductase [Pseudonocardia sp.]|nr:MAG: aldo/keto reductase [Pseudonocardia sp.]